MEQTHSNIVQYIDNNNYCLENADSIVISINEECADHYYVPTVMVADCTPVLLANLDGDVLAAVCWQTRYDKWSFTKDFGKILI